MIKWNYMEDKTPDNEFDEYENGATCVAKSFLVSARKSAQGYSGEFVDCLCWVKGSGWVIPTVKEGVKYEVYAWMPIPSPAKPRNMQEEG